MPIQNKSQTYINLIDLYFKFSQLIRDNPIYSNRIDNNGYRRDKVQGTSHRIMQPIVMADTAFIEQLTNQEKLIVMRIMCELKEYNCLWLCTDDIKKNSSNRTAINGLINKNVLQKTETTNIYVVNPFYIRRGDLMGVVTTTAKHLENASKVDASYITNKKPINEFQPIQITNQIHYGYSTDE